MNPDAFLLPSPKVYIKEMFRLFLVYLLVIKLGYDLVGVSISLGIRVDGYMSK